MAQLAGTYAANFPIAFEGQTGDGSADQHVRTYTDPASATSFGRAAIQGASAELFLVPGAGNGTFIGITEHTYDVAAGEVPVAGDGVPATQPVKVKSKGRIWVLPEDAIALGDTVFYRFQNAGASPEGKGRFRSDNDGASGDVAQLSTGARWLTAGGAGTPVLLEIDLPV